MCCPNEDSGLAIDALYKGTFPPQKVGSDTSKCSRSQMEATFTKGEYTDAILQMLLLRRVYRCHSANAF